MKVFILLSVVAVALASQECGENEHWETCGSACPWTCDNYDEDSLVCVLRCDIGCHCDNGYVRNSDGRCVLPEECPPRTQGVKAEEDICELPAETGMCRGFFPRFYFDKATGQCEKFVYGGCGGNENNFESKEACEESCASSAPKACHEPKVVGKCKAYLERYFYNTETEKCEKFIYGGCDGNSNNFNSQEDCEAVCSG